MIVYLSLGANIGNREATLRNALQLLEQQVGTCRCCSSFFYSAPWGFRSEHEFCNLCAAFDTELSPHDCLYATQGIEKALGRTEKSHNKQYKDRLIDIDILLYRDDAGNDLHISTPELTIPHPLIDQRDFVRIPLQEVLQTIL
ncbi:MAG: 2-amino-4-hydroxy-6-hydroxymethyldihydropteridine diphosphokinase [Paludibacteraceae bacterium]